MALTEAQRVKVRFYLGWSARFHQTDSRLEQAMNAIAAEAETQTQVETQLTALDDITTKLTASHARLKALQVGSIQLPGALEVSVLRSEGRRHAGALAATLGVDVRHDAFGYSRGDNTMLQA